MKKFKYVVFDTSFGFIPVLIPSGAKHDHVSLGNNKPVSAGFVHLSEEGPNCHGESVSLKLKCDQERDNKIMRINFYHY